MPPPAASWRQDRANRLNACGDHDTAKRTALMRRPPRPHHGVDELGLVPLVGGAVGGMTGDERSFERAILTGGLRVLAQGLTEHETRGGLER